jgi:hypothetical protein
LLFSYFSGRVSCFCSGLRTIFPSTAEAG